MALVFRGVADVTISRGAKVPGGLWKITKDCEASLDAYEGVSVRIYLKRYLTVIADGRPRDALFYQMRTSRGILPPSCPYLQTIADGYADFGLDVAPLQEALDESWEERDVTEFIADRYARRGRPALARSLPQPTQHETGFYLTDDELAQVARQEVRA
jgi:hypothetical protein